MLTYHGYDNGYNNTKYNVHKTLWVHYTWQNTVNARLKEIAIDIHEYIHGTPDTTNQKPTNQNTKEN